MKRRSFRHYLLKILFSSFTVLSGSILNAQIPTITSFTPHSGPVGTSVIISGTNFSTTPANNIVWFGAVKAAVTAASSTELTVTVPAGTIYRAISVTVSGNTAYSEKPFIVTFPSTHIIDAGAFAELDAFSAQSNPWDLAMGDLDEDGKPDLILLNSGTNIIAVYRNTSTSGYIVGGSLTGVDIPSGSYPLCTDIGDLDGDGKLDLAVTNNTDGTISIFRNTSTSGSITFDTRVDLTIGTSPYDVAIGDIDSDGKPDLAVTDNVSNTVSLLRNTSTPGSITSGSFAAKVDLATGANPSRLALSDIDRDGKPDLIVNNLDDNTVSIFRNISTPGSITSGSFASSIDFVTGSRPYGIAVGDLDGDGKPDLAVTNNGSSTVSVFRNTSTPGSISSGSLASKVDFTTGVDPYGLFIGEVDGDGRPDLAVACYGAGISVFRNITINGSITNNSFAPKVDFPAPPGPANVIIGDLDGDGKSDLLSVTNYWPYLAVHQNILSEPLLPVVTSLTPTSGPVGTIITISGNNFSATASENFVWFGAVQAQVTAASTTELTVTVPAGATYQPISVTVKGYTTWSDAPFIITFPTIRPLDASAFTTASDFTTGVYPWNVAFGDIDGDGKPDMAVTNASSNLVSVYRNTSSSGSIASGSFSEKVDFATGATPHGVKLCDIDGDGKQDLAVASSTDAVVSIFRNTSSSGTITTSSFAGRIDLPAGSGSMSIDFSDIDGDGKPDIIFQNSMGFSVYHNITTPGSIVEGSFEARVDFAAGTNPYDIAVTDIDGDGKPDIAVTDNTGNTVSVFRNTSTSGTINPASFDANVDFTTGSGPRDMIFGDIDDDGKPDMIVVNNNDLSVSVFRNISTSGLINSGSFDAKVDFTTGTSPNGAAIGDINGDGKQDLIITNFGSSTISVFRNTSIPGSITAGSLASKVDLATGAGPIGVAVGDIDGDGKPDLVTANCNSNNISVIRNKIAEPYPPVITSFTPISGPVGTAVTITGTHFDATSANNIVWFGAVQATVTAASATELTVIVPVGTTYQPITVTVSGNTAYSDAPFIVTFPSIHIIDEEAFSAKVDFTTGPTPYGAAILDIDEDGKPDLIVANHYGNTISVYKNTSVSGSITEGSFAARVDFTTGGNPYYVDIGDIDGDGKPDVIVTNSAGTISVFRNTSTPGSITSGSLSSRVDFTAGSDAHATAIGDFDCDGKPDLAVTNYGNSTVSVLRNTSTIGSLTPGSFAAKIDFATGINPTSVTSDDIDGDGKPDLAVANNGSNTISLFRNISISGSITEGSFAAKVDFTAGTNPYGIIFGDIDGDGRPDLSVTNFGSNTVSVFRNTSTPGSITSGSLASKVDFTTGTNPYGINIGNINGDSKPDLVVVNNNNSSISIFRNISISGSITSDSFTDRVDFTTGVNPAKVVINDIDGDGKPDLLVTNNSSSYISVLHNIIFEPVPPIITSFTPTSGPIGTVVTISGSDFSTTPANNIVWFGAVQATVTAASATELTVTVPAGATYQPITVTVKGMTGYSNTPFIVTFPDPQVIDSESFISKVDFNSPTNPQGAAIGDIDGDGKSDVVISNPGSNTVSIFRNTGTSRFITLSSFSERVDFITGSNPISVSIGDIDGDGNPDMVVANSDDNTVSVFRNTSTPGSITSGSFDTRVDFTAGTNPSDIAIADIDGDGKSDIAVTNYTGNTVSVFRNTSAPGYIATDSFAAKADFTTGSAPQCVVIGDIDGDGKPDLSVTNYNSNTFSVFRNTSTPGSISSGSFDAKADFTTGMNPFDIAFGDIDLDGKPEISVVNPGTNAVSVFRNTSTSGAITAGSFAASVDFTSGTAPESITIGDINGDGKPDLAVANSSGNSVSVLMNTSTPGSMTTGSFAAKVDFQTGAGPSDIVMGDIDGDGKSDLAVTNNGSSSFSVFRNRISEPFPPIITSFAPTSGPVGTSVTITGTNFDTTPANNIVWFGAVRATVTTASATELSVIVPTGTSFQPISVTVNGLTAFSDAPFNVTFTSTRIIAATSLASKIDISCGPNPFYAAVNDLDGDGKPDLVITNEGSNTISIFRNTSTIGSISTGSFAPKVDLATGTNPKCIVAGDIDGDGKPDLIFTNFGSNTVSVYRNISSPGSISSGSFAAKVDFVTGLNPFSVNISDIDCDGKPDLVVTNYAGGTISVLMNASTTGTINAGSFAPKVDFNTGTNPYFAAIGDIDGDGKPDVAVANFNSATVSVFRNTSTPGSIQANSFAARIDLPTGTGTISVALADIDGDSKPDLTVLNNHSSILSIFRNTSTSGIIDASSFAAEADFTTGANPYHVSIGDVNGDGKQDLAITNPTYNTISLFRNTSSPGFVTSGSLAARVEFSTWTSPFTGAFGDIDGDGKPDVIVVNSNSNVVSVYRNIIPEPMPPVISSFTPISGPAGTTVTIEGSNFSATPSENTVLFGTVNATVTAATTTQLTVTVPVGATDNLISVTVYGLTAATVTPFTVTALTPPLITSFTPASGPVGTTVTINGNNFSTTPANNIIWFGAVRATVTAATATQLTVTVPAGASYQPVSVTVDGRTAYSASPFIVTFPGTRVIDATSYTAKVDLSAGLCPQNVVISDIDLDSKPDLIVSNINSNNISVFKNNAVQGMFSADNFTPRIDFNTGMNPDGIAAGDVDGDGKQDLLVINRSSNTVSVYRNTSSTGILTSGSFATGVDFSTGTNPYNVTIGDIDGDGKPDLVVTNYSSNTVSLFRNTGNAGSVSASSFAARFDISTGNNPYGISLVDIDNDGKPDLIVTNANSNTVSVFRNTGTPGTIDAGSFAPKVDLTTGLWPISVATGDIDRDGKPDMVILNNNNSTVSVFRNNSTSGSITAGSFDTRIDLNTQFPSRSVAIGDIDGDGKPDLAIAGYSGNIISVFKNISSTGSITSGSFAARVEYAPGSGPQCVALGDLDGDSRLDIVATSSNNNTVSILRNTIPVPVPPVISSFTPTSGPAGTTVTITGSNFSTTASNNIVWFGAVQATVTAASATELTVTVPTGATYQPITVTVNGLTAYSRVPFNVTFPSTKIIDVTAFASKVDFNTGTNPQAVAIGDIDGDGKPDLVVTNWASDLVSVYRNTSISGSISAGTFITRVDFSTGSYPSGVAIGDIDGDGKPDIIVTNAAIYTVSIFRNTSTFGSITAGSFASRVDFTTGSAPNDVAIGDIDGDGKPDLAVTNKTNTSVSVFRNTSTTGSITTSSLAAKVDFITGSAPCDVAIGDIDGDGKPDLVVTNSNSGTISVFRNTCISGSITASSFDFKVDFTTGTTPGGAIIGDIDGDGKPDLAVANYSSMTISVLRNVGTSGLITTASFAAKEDFITGSQSYYATIDDIDGDGKPDLAVTNSNSNTVSIFRNTSTSGSITSGSFAAKIEFASGNNPRSVTVGDIDGDGKPDLVVTNESGNTISVFRNTISAPVPPVITSFTPTSGPIGTDVIITGTNFSTTSANNIIWFGAVRATVTAASATELTVSVPVGATYQPITVTVSGLTAYSSAPFIVTFPSTRVIDATAFAPLVNFPTGMSPHGVAIGDLDSDGKPDLVVVNTGSDAISVFRNSSSPGSIASVSFPSRIDFPAENSSQCVAIGDINGDSKPDLIVTNRNSMSVSVYQNTSISGSITSGSFAAKVNFQTGTNPQGIAIGDIDADGKPDLAVLNSNNNTVSVLKNTSTFGSISSGSFAAKVDFATGTNPSAIAVGDIDGDGKPDLVIANFPDNTVSLLRNISTSGSITTSSFAAKVDLIALTNGNPSDIAIGDIDGDGKPDLVVTNYSSNNISVFRNKSTPGSITSDSFDNSTVAYPAGANPRSIAIGDIDGDGKPDLTITNYTDNTVSVFRNLSTSGQIGVSSLAARVDFTVEVNSLDVAVGDLDCDGKMDIITSGFINNSISVLRNTISESVPPVITSFTPNSGPVGTTVTIEGSNFSTTPANNYVFFGAVQATVSSATDTLLTVIVPAGATTQPISVTVNGLTAISGTSFTVTASPSDTPVITSFNPTSGPVGATVTITGSNFSTNISENIVRFGIVQAAVVSATATELTVIVPAGATNQPIFVTVNSLTAYTSTSFIVTSAPVITSFNPASGPVGTTVTIEGSNFGTTPADNAVFFGTVQATVASATTTQLTVIVPAGATTQPVSVTVNGFTVISATSFTVTASPTGAPVINSFNPTSGTVGAYVTITGSNFSVNISENIVRFGTVQAAVISATPTQLTVIVPAGATNQPIFVTVNGLTAYTSVSFIVIYPPVINSFNPTSATTGSSVTITGSNFSTNISDNIVRFGDLQATVLSATGTQLTVTVPNGATIHLISVTVNGLTAYSGMPFTVIPGPEPPVIASFDPASGPVGTTVTIYGANFSTTPGDNIVMFGDSQAMVTGAMPNQLVVIVPAGTGNQTISVTVNGLTGYSGAAFTVTVPQDIRLESTILTLNGDGINERLQFGNFQAYGKCSFYVYNSRGALIFSNKDFMGEWDLTINGRMLETGGYFYVIETELGTFRGSFSILR